MSAVSNDSGGGLYTLVEAQRGMSPTEIFNFLTTGEVPDLSQPPKDDVDSDDSDLYVPTDEDVMALLSPVSITASASLFSQKSHHNDLINNDVTYHHDDDIIAAGKKRKWKAEQHPRDRRGRFIEKGAVVDLLSAKKPTIQHLLSAVKELDQARWDKLTDTQQEHIAEHVDRLPSGAGPATAEMKSKLAKLTSTTTIDKDVKTPDAKSSDDDNVSDTPAGGSSLTPAVIYKKHADGAVIAESADRIQRMRWDANRKKFIVENRDSAGSWNETAQLTKTAAYADVKTPNKWFEPSTIKTEDQISPTSSSQTSENTLLDSQPTGKISEILDSKTPLAKIAPGQQEDAVSRYRLGAYAAINRQLRHGTPQKVIGADIDDVIAGLDAAIAANTVNDDTYVWRGLNISPGDIKIGTVLEDKGFMSTSLKRDQAEVFAFSPPDINAIGTPSPTLFNIKIPKGSHALNIGGGEGEILLPRGSKIKVTNTYTNKQGLTVVNADITTEHASDELPDVDSSPVTSDTSLSTTAPEYLHVPGGDVESIARQNIDDWQRTMYDTGGTGEDAILKKIAEAQGWDKLPRTGTKEELDAAIASGGTVAYRGVTGGDEKALFKDATAAKGLSAGEILDRFREGPLYYGTGIYGNGIYTAERHDKALKYAGGNEDGVVRVVISPDAKVIDDETLHDEYVAWLNTIPKFSPMATVFSDPNRYAAMRGYDVVTMESPVGGRFNIVLNRSALMIEKPDTSQSDDQAVNDITPTIAPTSTTTTSVAEVTTPSAPTPASATTKTLITPTKAIYAKGIANDDVVAESATGDRRIRWSDGRKRFIDESRGANGEWSETEALTKSAAYAKLKTQGSEWYTPDVSRAHVSTDAIAIEDPVELHDVTPTAPSATVLESSPTSDVNVGQRINDINSEIASIIAANRTDLDEYKRLSDKAKKGKALTSSELSAFNGSLFAVAQSVNAQVRALTNEKLDVLTDDGDFSFGSVPQLDASRWEIPRKPSAAIMGGLSADAKKTRDDYVINDVKTLKNNSSLRSASPSAAAKAWRDRVDSWINSSTITNDATVYRGTALTPEQIIDIRPGTVMSDPGIMSTDESLENASFYADRRLEFTPGTVKTMFTINVPKGANGVNADYGEYVFGSNTPLRIISTERVGDEVHVRAQIVSPGDDTSIPTTAPDTAPDTTPTPISTDPQLSSSGGVYSGPSLQIPDAVTSAMIDEFMALETRRLATNKGYGNGDLTDDEINRLWALADEIRDNGDAATLMNLEQRATVHNSFMQWRKEVGLENIPEDEIKARAAARMRDVLADKKIGIRVTPNTLQNIINDGRVKTQFETNTSSGANAPTYRAEYEANWFGIGQGLTPSKAALIDKEKRPIYGYVMTDGVRPIGRNLNTESMSAMTDLLNHYGDVQIVLKDGVRDRTTVTVGDSLDSRNATMPSPINNPEWYSFRPTSGRPGVQDTTLDSDLTESKLRHDSYVEAQIHNGVSIDDIDEVIFPKKPSNDVINQLDSRGIPWRVLRDTDVDNLTIDQRNATRKRLLDDIAMYNRKLIQLDELSANNPKNKMYPSDRQKITNEITRLQDIIAKLGDTDNSSLNTSSQDLSIADQLRASYDSGYTVDEKLSGGDVALSVERITLADGKRAVRKQSEMMQETRKEVLSGAIAEALGLDNVATAQLDDHTTIAEFVDGTVGSRFIREKYDEFVSDPGNSELSENQLGKLAQVVAHEAAGSKQIALLDFLTNNGDRHGGNFIVRPDGSVRPIDHGSVLFDSGSTDPLLPDDSFWIESPFVETWLRPERDKNRRLISLNPRLTSNDIIGVRERLEQLKSQFNQSDEQAWFDGMMRRLSVVEKAVNQ